jgi:hypothetical protein
MVHNLMLGFENLEQKTWDVASDEENLPKGSVSMQDDHPKMPFRTAES